MQMQNDDLIKNQEVYSINPHLLGIPDSFLAKISIGLLIILRVWLVIGLSATIHLSNYEDFGLVIAGVCGFILINISNKKLKKAEAV